MGVLAVNQHEEMLVSLISNRLTLGRVAAASGTPPLPPVGAMAAVVGIPAFHI